MSSSTDTPPIRVTATVDDSGPREFEFKTQFSFGRGGECAVCIKNEFVSRVHADVFYHQGQWWLRDLQSSNGTYLDGNRIETVPLRPKGSIQLGKKGPVVAIEIVQPALAPRSDEVVAKYVDRYFGDRPAGEPVGEHTMYVRKAFSQVQKKQKRRYTGVMVVLGVLLIAAGAVAWVEHRQASQQRASATELFYAMKLLDVNIARVEKMVMDSGNKAGIDQVRSYQSQRKAMEDSYSRYLTTLKIYDTKKTEEERLILRVARIFGECEMDMPPEFMAEIKEYIKKWQSSPRYANAIRTALANNYTPTIVQEFLAQNLPPEFFYLALQESNFDAHITGPPTHMGRAKGMWQFIPKTAAHYGLKVGPLLDLDRVDVADDRHNWQAETKAAASYIKDLFSMDAQASGLLVMACYNWGEDRVLPLVKTMPANPRERNFWKLLTQYREKVPGQTYDYVFYIVSAAVIGENPRLFGFNFDSPLAKYTAR